MKITTEELDELVQRAAHALDELYSVIYELKDNYGAGTEEDGTPIDVALLCTWGDSDEIRRVIVEAIETAEMNDDPDDDGNVGMWS